MEHLGCTYPGRDLSGTAIGLPQTLESLVLFGEDASDTSGERLLPSSLLPSSQFGGPDLPRQREEVVLGGDGP